MSFRQAFSAICAAVSLTVLAADASAQYRYHDRPSFDGRWQRQARPAPLTRANFNSASRPVAQPRKLAETPKPTHAAAASKPVPATAPPVATTPVTAAKPIAAAKPVAPPSPLTEEQIAAKSVIDELIARDPALSAVREVPDPKLAKGAAARHDAQERQLAALKAKEEAAITKRKELEERSRAREEAKVAALKAKQETQGRTAKLKTDVTPKTDVKPSLSDQQSTATASVAIAPPVLPQPVRRMPTP